MTDLLGVGPGTLIYHLLLTLALWAMVIVALVEWQHTRNPDRHRAVWAFWGLLALRFLLLFGGLIGPAAVAPLLNGLEAASLVLLGWVFLSPLLRYPIRRLYLPCGFGVACLGSIISLLVWRGMLDRSPALVYAESWQQPLWHVLCVFLTLVPVLVLWSTPQRGDHWFPLVGFAILALGCVTLLVGSLFMAFHLPGMVGSILVGVGYFVDLLAYPFFAVSVYRASLQDMWTYRQELQAISEEALRQTQELLFLVEASRTTGESLDLDTILQRVAESTAMAMDADCAAIFLIDSGKLDSVRLAAQYTPLRRTKRLAVPAVLPLAEQPMLSHALRRRKQLILNDVEDDDPRLQAMYELLGSHKAGPVIIQPLLRQNRVLGALVLGNDHRQRAFEPTKGRLSQSIAVQVAAAVENARLYRDLQAQAGQLARLLQTQEEEIRRRMAILESIAEGVIVSDETGKITIVNAAAERILGAPRQRILGRMLDRLAGHAAPDSEANWEAIARSDAPLQTVFDLEGKVVYVSAAPVLTPAGDHLGVVAVLRDITREVGAEQSKSEFIASVSQELRTPLTAIRGYAEAVSKGMVGPVNEAQTHFLNIVRDHVSHMISLAENLITVSEADKGGIRLDYAETDLHLIVGEVLKDYRREIEQRRLDVILELDDHLPLLEADPKRVRQMVDNLVSNAVKFSYPGGHVTIGAELTEGDEQVPKGCRITVSDTGIGIAPEEQALIWERFYRPENPLVAEASGLGVGLSIVKSLAQAHGGRVWVESAPGVGSEFSVLLPLERATPR